MRTAFGFWLGRGAPRLHLDFRRVAEEGGLRFFVTVADSASLLRASLVLLLVLYLIDMSVSQGLVVAADGYASWQKTYSTPVEVGN